MPFSALFSRKRAPRREHHMAKSFGTPGAPYGEVLWHTGSNSIPLDGSLNFLRAQKFARSVCCGISRHRQKCRVQDNLCLIFSVIESDSSTLPFRPAYLPHMFDLQYKPISGQLQIPFGSSCSSWVVLR
ncbi:hypothetical protein BCR43DRAFT_91313 [Syncephalastrum racemosum]|uniref:Uncharacterized protein n=1 Tax=Syncephalastrum racemosum TaxID=13706 RepID=A0A1X2H1S3_SYNRA|nr:hypothetical protein BCR43DRAFT_91313 [Syncephalastrum racemosum]